MCTFPSLKPNARYPTLVPVNPASTSSNVKYLAIRIPGLESGQHQRKEVAFRPLSRNKFNFWNLSSRCRRFQHFPHTAAPRPRCSCRGLFLAGQSPPRRSSARRAQRPCAGQGHANASNKNQLRFRIVAARSRTSASFCARNSRLATEETYHRVPRAGRTPRSLRGR